MNAIVDLFEKIPGFLRIVGIIGIGAFLGICFAKGSGRKNRRNETASLPENASVRQTETCKAREQELRNDLLKTEKRLWEIKTFSPCEKIFERSAMSLQILLGLANVSLDTLTEERRDYYLWDMILHPLVNAVRDGGGRTAGGELMVPDAGKRFAEEETRQRISKINARELEGCLQENEARIRSGEIAGQKMRVVKGLGSVIEKLQELEQKKTVTDEEIRSLAKKVRTLLEENEIYPMTAQDDRLGPQLRKQFIPPKKNALRYPGLFIRRGSEWEVLGANIGMDD